MPLELKPGVTLYIARHGETVANIEHRFSGKKDTPLTPLGREQAEAIGRILRHELGAKPDIGFVASPLHRARITMEIAREHLDLPPQGYTTDARIAEIDLGIWDELTDDEARALDPKLFYARGNDKWNIRVPGGENYSEVAARAESWARDLSRNTFAVSHGAFTRIFRGLFAGMSWKDMSNLDEPQGCVFEFRNGQSQRLDDTGSPDAEFDARLPLA